MPMPQKTRMKISFRPTTTATATHARASMADYTSGKALMAHGAEVLHDHFARRVEAATGRALPQMEVRFSNLTLTTAVTVRDHGNSDSDTNRAHALPTLTNDLRAIVRGLLPGSTRTVTKHILKDVSGVFKAGSMTLVLGQPGSGKSSLLKVLSGRFPMGAQTALEGEIWYNGQSFAEMQARLPQFVTYVDQHDTHFPTLSVQETLQFAHECCGAELTARDEQQFTEGSPEENLAALNAARALYKHYPGVVVQQLGLEGCQGTRVGNAQLRGISGGERKRVTTGEMQFGNKYVSLMDEISTGLDSAATFDIVKTQRSLATKLKKTVVIALLQPAPEVFALFDNVLLLNQGRVLYNGPREDVLAYFQSLGLECPPTRDTADFLLDLATDQQVRYEIRQRDSQDKEVRTSSPQPAESPPRHAREYAKLYAQSSTYTDLLGELYDAHDPHLLHDVRRHFDHVPCFHQSFVASTWTLVKRAGKVTWRNVAFLRGRVFMIGIVGLLYATLFYQFNPADPLVVIGTLFTAILSLMLGQSAQIPNYMLARDVFYKQRGAHFYRTTAYVVANSISLIPMAVAETVVFGSMVYFICGLTRDLHAFLVFELLLFLMILSFSAWFFFISAIAPNQHLATPMGLVSILLFLLFAGFIITKDDLPVYFIWAYWLSPISWCLRSLAINQYSAAEFAVCKYRGIDYCARFQLPMGAYSLQVFDFPVERGWITAGVVVMALSYIGFMTLATLVLEHHRYEHPEQVTLDAPEPMTRPRHLLKKHGSSLASSARTACVEEYYFARSPQHSMVSISRQAYTSRVPLVTLAFKQLGYSVVDPKNAKNKLQLLKNVTGYALPGSMTALMGSSGAGKTTLMDVIAGRKTAGTITGQILLNGHQATDLAIRRATGYCQQRDVHSSASTFREAMIFSAFLRQGSGVSYADKYESVEECLDLLDLRSLADQIIRGSSVEQMKRLTIGVELAAQPSVLFLDEPTSGLDARAARAIMEGVRKVAHTGRTVVCTIHQPSWEVFRLFDSLLLLKRGGETVFFGDLGMNARELIRYFERIPGTPCLEKGYNPATWMLDVIGAGVGGRGGEGGSTDTDFAAVFLASNKKALLDYHMDQDGVARPAPETPPLTYTSKRAASNWTQAMFLLHRFAELYWRTSSYNLTRVGIYVALSVIFGLYFFGIDYDTYRGINTGVGMIFTTTMFAGLVAFESIMTITIDQRAAFYRERACETYSTIWYFVAASLIEIPYIALLSLVFCGIFFPFAGFTGIWRFLHYWMYLFLYVLQQAYLGQLYAVALPRMEIAFALGAMTNAVMFLFMGFNPPVSAIPSGYQWLHRLVPAKYAASLIGALVFGDCDPSSSSSSSLQKSEYNTALGCHVIQDVPPTVRAGTTVHSYIESVFDMSREDAWYNGGILVAGLVVFRVLTLLAMRYINHQTT